MEWIERLAAKLKVPWGRAPLAWLRKFDWTGAAKAAGTAARQAFENALKKAQAAAKWATGAVKERLLKLADIFKAIIGRVETAIRDAAAKVRDKLGELLGKEKKEIGKYDATPGTAPNKHVVRGHLSRPRLCSISAASIDFQLISRDLSASATARVRLLNSARPSGVRRP